MARWRRLAVGVAACALVSGEASAQATFFWTGGSFQTSDFGDASNWAENAVPANNNTQILGFFSASAKSPNGNQMNLDVGVNALGLDIEADKASGGGANISIDSANGDALKLGASGIWMNQTDNKFPSVASISAPVILGANQTWSLTNSLLTVSGPISEAAAGKKLKIDDVGGGLGEVTLDSGASTFSGGLTVTGSGAEVEIGASSSGPAGNPTSGPVGTGTLTLANGTGLFALSSSTVTLGNNIVIGTGSGASAANLLSASGTLRLTGVISDDGTGTGKLELIGIGQLDLEGANTYSGGTTVFGVTANGTTLTVGNDQALGTGPLSSTTATIDFTDTMPVLDGLQLSSSTLKFADMSAIGITDMVSDMNGSSNVINLGQDSTLTMQVDSATSYYGTITGTGTSKVSFTTGSSGSLDLFGANTYPGGTTIGHNVLVIADASSATNSGPLGTGSISLSGGGAALGVASGVTITNSISTFSNGSVIEGYGTVAPGTSFFLNDSHGSILVGGKGSEPVGFSSSSVPGKLTFGANVNNIILGNQGVMQFSIMNAVGTAGVDYSQINAPSATVNVTALAATPFTIQLVSVNPATGQMGLANFNDTTAHSWTLLTAFSINNFAANKFTIDDTTDFSNALGGGSFSISELGGNSLVLSFTPVPEPSTWALMATGLCALGAVVRRRRS